MRSVMTRDGKLISAKDFARVLIEMLESSQRIVTNCPARLLRPISTCGYTLCRDFFDLPKQLNNKGQIFGCPCHILGCEEAVKTAWLWLEDNNFI